MTLSLTRLAGLGWAGPQPGGGGAAGPAQGVNFGGAQLPIDPLVTNMAMNLVSEKQNLMGITG